MSRAGPFTLSGVARSVTRRGMYSFTGTARRLVFASCALLPRSARRRIAQGLRSLFADAADCLDTIPAERLSRTVLFISLQPHSREVRLASAARAAGWDPVLVYVGQTRQPLAESFGLRARVSGYPAAILVSWYFRGPVVHVFALTGDAAYPLIRTKVHPTALDVYDTAAGMRWWPRAKQRDERVALAMADGMAHRDTRVKRLQRLRGYRIPRVNVFVPDLLEAPPERRDPRIMDHELRVVSSGWIDANENSILRVVTALASARVHVHLYLNPFQGKGEGGPHEGYFRLSEASPYVHIEEPVFGAKYREALRRYDFGLCVFEPLIFNEPIRSYTRDYLESCGSSRLTDFIEAGLGIIVSPELRFQTFLARRYGCAVVPASREFLEDPAVALCRAQQEIAAAPPKNIVALTSTGCSSRVGSLYDALVRADGVCTAAPIAAQGRMRSSLR